VLSCKTLDVLLYQTTLAVSELIFTEHTSIGLVSIQISLTKLVFIKLFYRNQNVDSRRDEV